MTFKTPYELQAHTQARQQTADYASVVGDYRVPHPTLMYDYRHQCWVEMGRWLSCGHPDRMEQGCRVMCWGKVHQGEQVRSEDAEYCA